jgi:chromosome partitioning protein
MRFCADADFSIILIAAMKTIVLAARKGGSGKTTLAAHLGVQAELVSQGPVTFIDTDPQQSLTAWWNDRQAQHPRLLEVAAIGLLPVELGKVRSAPGFVVVDTPPLDSTVIASVINVADLVVIPVKPSPHDLRGVSVTVDMCKKTGRPFVFVVVQAVQRATLTQQAPLILSQFGPVATSIIYNRVDYAGAMTDGRTVQEIEPKGKAAGEIAGLWIYLSQQLSMSAVGA